MNEHANGRRRGATPAIACLIGILLVILAFSIEGLWSSDLWWQLATGRWILENGRVPVSDIFSYTATGHEWIELRWLFCLGTYLGWQLGGPTLLITAKTLLISLTFLAIAAPAPRAVRSLPGAVILSLAVIASVGRFAVRPELITYLFLITFIVSLERLASDRCRRGLWFMPLAQVIWTNSHTLFILGPVVCWCYWFGSLLRPTNPPLIGVSTNASCNPRPSRLSPQSRLLLTAILVCLACLANPYFLRGAIFPFKLFSEMQHSHFLSQHIEELRSIVSAPISSWSLNIWAAVLLLLVSSASFLVCGKNLQPARVMLLLAFAYLAVTSIRNVTLFAIVAAAFALRNLEEQALVSNTCENGSPPASKCKSYRAAGQLTLACILFWFAWYAASNRFAQSQSENRRAGGGIVEWNIPRRAVDFLRQTGAAREVYSFMADGDYLTWAASDKYRVFIDGRLEVYGDHFLNAYFSQSDDFDALVAKFGISTVLVQRQNFEWLIGRLATDPQWVLVYLDFRNLVYVRDIPAHAGLIAQYRLDPQKPYSPPHPEPDESVTGFARWIGGVGRPWYSLGMARSFLTFGAIDNAEHYLAQALKSFPDDINARSLMSAVQTVRGRPTEAERLLAGISLSNSQIADREFVLSELLRNQHRYVEAASALARAAEVVTDDALILSRLAETYILANDLPHAITTFRAAIAITPREPRLWMRLGICLESMGDQAGATHAYREAVRLNPGLYIVQNQLGILLVQQGSLDEARKCFEAALRVQPNYESARSNLQKLMSSSVPPNGSQPAP